MLFGNWRPGECGIEHRCQRQIILSRQFDEHVPQSQASDNISARSRHQGRVEPRTPDCQSELLPLRYTGAQAMLLFFFIFACPLLYQRPKKILACTDEQAKWKLNTCSAHHSSSQPTKYRVCVLLLTASLSMPLVNSILKYFMASSKVSPILWKKKYLNK